MECPICKYDVLITRLDMELGDKEKEYTFPCPKCYNPMTIRVKLVGDHTKAHINLVDSEVKDVK